MSRRSEASLKERPKFVALLVKFITDNVIKKSKLKVSLEKLATCEKVENETLKKDTL